MVEHEGRLEHEVLVQRLEHYYKLVTSQILQHQSLTHGLFPLHVDNCDDGKINGKEGHVRDNIYCALCIWTLSLAYRHVDNNGGRQYELEQSAVKCMRGILFFYMLQADRVEAFKKDQQLVNALHSKFNIKTCAASQSHDDQKSQMDAVALYLIVLVQMIESGLYIIFTTDEVHFIQNLVYYIERTYRTADFGMWGRGTRYNNGQPELHASSIGMVKSALEAINGFNLFGTKGTQTSVVYVDPDAHFRNKSTLNSLLPRESNSKKSDAALLAIIGYPGFSITEKKLRKQTRETLLSELEGVRGCKRFYCDSLGSVLEGSSHRLNHRGEAMKYESVECEWPMFYLFSAIDAMFQSDSADTKMYMDKVEKCMRVTKHGKTLPWYFYIAEDEIELERRSPGSATRLANEELFLWGQSLYLIAMMLVERLVRCEELDPVGRSVYEQTGRPPRHLISQRYSSFQVSSDDLVVQICLISENRSLKANLLTYGIETQTPKEIEPMVICPPHDLVQVYEVLGKNGKLNLSGRPLRPFGGLGTSKVYKILGKIVVTYPQVFDEKGFYMSFDMSLLIEELKTCLAFIRRSWNMTGRPTVCFFLRDHNFRGLHSTAMVDFMAELKSGKVDGVNVKLGKLQCLLDSACVEHLDYLKEKECAKINIITNDENLFLMGPCGFESVQHPVLNTDNNSDTDVDTIIATASHLPTHEIVHQLRNTSDIAVNMALLQVLLGRDGPAYSIDETSVEDCINEIYVKACFIRNWSVVRRGASLLGKSVASMAPCVTSMLVSGKQVILGPFGEEGHVINEPLTTGAIKDIIYSMCMSYDPREVSLQQEVVVYLGNIVTTKPMLFKGMHKISVGWIIQAMKRHYGYALKMAGSDSSNPLSIYDLYPNEVQQLLIAVLSAKGTIRGYDITPRTMLEKRALEGALNRVPTEFYTNVWGILKRVQGGIQVKDCHLSQQPILNEMTSDEFQFKVRVEELLQEMKSPVERQILVECIMVLWTVLERNPEISVRQIINLTEVVDYAIQLYIEEDSATRKRWDFYNLPHRQTNGSMMYLSRSIVTNVLNNSLVEGGENDENCCIS